MLPLRPWTPLPSVSAAECTAAEPYEIPGQGCKFDAFYVACRIHQEPSAGLRSGLEGRVGFDYKMFTKLKNISLCILPLAAQNLWTTATDANSSWQASKAF